MVPPPPSLYYFKTTFASLHPEFHRTPQALQVVLTIVLKNFPLTTIKFLDHIKWFEPKPLAMESICESFLINPKSRTASNSTTQQEIHTFVLYTHAG
jgi:hypothetical protein